MGENGEGYPSLLTRGSMVAYATPSTGSGANNRPKVKTILVLSKRDRTPLIADFARFQSDRK